MACSMGPGVRERGGTWRARSPGSIWHPDFTQLYLEENLSGKWEGSGRHPRPGEQQVPANLWRKWRFCGKGGGKRALKGMDTTQQRSPWLKNLSGGKHVSENEDSFYSSRVAYFLWMQLFSGVRVCVQRRDMINYLWSQPEKALESWSAKLRPTSEWIHVYVYVWLNPFTIHLKISQHYYRLHPNTKYFWC